MIVLKQQLTLFTRYPRTANNQKKISYFVERDLRETVSVTRAWTQAWPPFAALSDRKHHLVCASTRLATTSSSPPCRDETSRTSRCRLYHRLSATCISSSRQSSRETHVFLQCPYILIRSEFSWLQSCGEFHNRNR